MGITQSKNRKKLRKQKDQNRVEKEEDLKVPNDICKHDHDGSQRRENSQEEECLDNEKEDDDAPEDPCRKYEGVIDDLKNGICNTAPNVDETRIVARV